MKKDNKWKLSEVYKEKGYSEEIIENIKWLEMQYPFPEDLLEEYRYVQQDGELFSERSLKIIIALYNIERMLEAQKDIVCDIEENLRNLIKLSFQRDEVVDDFPLDNDTFKKNNYSFFFLPLGGGIFSVSFLRMTRTPEKASIFRKPR